MIGAIPGSALRPVALAAVLVLGACATLEPEVGAPVRDFCQNLDSDPDTDISYQTDIVEGIFSVIGEDDPTACENCHTPTGATPIGVEVGGLDLSSYESLRRGGVVSGSNIVIPGQPCDSLLVLKVLAGPPAGSRMPLAGPPFLQDDEIQTLIDWIAEGARDN